MADRRICAVEGCDKTAAKRGWCGTHYQRWRLNGDPLALRKLPNGTCLRWIKDHVNHTGDDCLIWPFSRKADTGYAKLNRRGRIVHAHRVMCELAHGEAPAGQPEAAHSCGRGHLGCIHPGHLRWASRSENFRDKRDHGTNPRGEDTSCAVLTEAQVLEVVALAKASSERKLARKFGVHRSTINCILSGRSWGWLTGITGSARWQDTAPMKGSQSSF